MKRLSLIVLALGLASCSDITQPVVAIGKDGRMMKGSATASMSGEGSYTMTDGKITCSGSYNAFDLSATIPLSILCNNGLTGIGSATRTADGMSGSGTFTTSDGRDWRFVFGRSATALF
jgi:hypothetical protein